MKRLSLLITPLMAVSFLVSCGGGGSETKEYTAKWLDYNGNVLKEEKCKEGTVPVYEDATHGTPTRESDPFHDYTFAAWAPTPVEIHSDQAYVATYDELSFDTQVYMQVNITNNKSFTFYQNEESETYTQGIFVDWGDGQSSTVATRKVAHNYNNSGIYNIRISGDVADIRINANHCNAVEKAYFGRTLTAFHDMVSCKECTNLKSVTFAENSALASIGDSAFYRCSSLTSINIPNSVTSIGPSAFYGCSSLTSINIPNSVTSIGASAFYGCSSLTSINIPNGVTSIESLTFSDCSSLTSINIPSSIVSIGSYAFDKCTNLKSVTFAENSTLANIDNSAFYRCSSLTSINIPSSVTYIDSYAFGLCPNLVEIKVDTANQYYTSQDKNKNECRAIITKKETLDGTPADTLIVGCKATVIPNSVISIIDGAFYECPSLVSINIPSSVTSIKIYAFGYCSDLVEIKVDINNQYFTSQNENKDGCNAIITKQDTPNGISTNTLVVGCKATVIPNTVTSIAEGAFYGCSSLTSINIPSSVTNIEGYAFDECASLATVNLTAYTTIDTIPSYNSDAFYGCSDNLKFHVASEEMKAKFIENSWPEAQIVIGK